jgi:hypothetical protein
MGGSFQSASNFKQRRVREFKARVGYESQRYPSKKRIEACLIVSPLILSTGQSAGFK